MSPAHPVDAYVGERLKKRRKKLSISQIDLAERLDISYQLIQKYEAGQTRISVSTLYDLSVALGVTPSYFYEGFVPQGHDLGVSLPSESDLIKKQKRESFNVLLIEDDPEDEILTRKAIEEYNDKINVHTEYDGVSALSYLRGISQAKHGGCLPDIILLDLNIPKRSGLEVLKEIKRDRSMQFIPVVIVSNSINALEMLDCYRSYASGYLCKSFDLKQFRSSIGDILSYWFASVVMPTHY